MKKEQIEYQVANEFAISLVSAIATKYKIPETKVLKVLDEIHYWDVLNNDRVCCTVAHDGVKYVMQRLEGEINGVLSRNR